MGISCIAPAKKRSQNVGSKSNTLQSELNSKDDNHNSNPNPNPKPKTQRDQGTITLSSYQHLNHKESLIYQLSKDVASITFQINRQFTYKQQLTSFNSMYDIHAQGSASAKFKKGTYPQNTQYTPRQSSSFIVRPCELLDRQYWHCNGYKTFIDRMSAYIIVNQQIQNQTPPGKISISSNHTHMQDILLIKVGSTSSKQISMQRCVQTQASIQGRIMKLSTQYQQHHTYTNVIYSGVCFFNKESIKEQHPILKILNIALKLQGQFEMILCSSGSEDSKVFSNNVYDKQLTTYFQLAHFVFQRYGSFWNIRQNQFLIHEKEEYFAFIAVQIIRFLINTGEREFKLGSQKGEEVLLAKKQKIINDCMSLNSNAVNSIILLSHIIFSFQSNEGNKIRTYIWKVLQSFQKQIPIIADGLFIEVGYEINEKEHPFRKRELQFIQNDKQVKDKLLKSYFKHSVSFDNKLANLVISCIKTINCSSKHLNYYFLQGLEKSFTQNCNKLLLKVKQNPPKCNRFGDPFSNQLYLYQDLLLRFNLYRVIISFIQSNAVPQDEWAKAGERVNNMKYVCGQTLLSYLSIAAIIQSSFNKSQPIVSPLQDWHYLKSIDLIHRLYGDPRSKISFKRQKQHKWELFILENYIKLYQKITQNAKLNYLNNIMDCLKEDLIDKRSYSQASNKLQWIIESIPMQNCSGIFYMKSDILDFDNQDSKSNFSESFSASSKKSKKSTKRINQFESSSNVNEYCGVIKWGQNVSSLPSVLAPLKNIFVLKIASGNYHSVFITEEGLFGYGQGQSGQLGEQNKGIISRSNPVMIRKVQIHREKDKYEISCGNEHTAFLLNGVLEMWGPKDGGITGGHGLRFDFIKCGGLHSIGIKDGIAYSWGRGEGGQLGHPIQKLKQIKKKETTQFFIDSPCEIPNIKQVIKAVCGDAHSILLTADGIVYVFGFCYQGQLGLGITGDNEIYQIFQPVQLPLSKQVKIVDIFAGPTFSFFKTWKGQLYSCGLNDYLQLGIDRILKVFQKKKFLNRTQQIGKKKVGEVQFSNPRRIDMFGSEVNLGLNLVGMECGESHCLAQVKYQDKDDLIMGWGLNKNYQIGVQFTEVTTPRTLDSLFGLKVRQVCCGGTYSLANIGSFSLTFNQSKQQIYNLLKQFQSKVNILHF